jgi:hypothetical protein
MASPGPDTEEGTPLDKAAVPAEVPAVPARRGQLSDAALGAFCRLGHQVDGGPVGDRRCRQFEAQDALRGVATPLLLGDSKDGLTGGQQVLVALVGAYWSVQAGGADSRKRRELQQG